jgi:hypothetical protein
MYERSYGTKYQEFFTDGKGEHVWRTAAEIAAQIRADIKAEVAAGALPKATYSVTSETYSGGRSIRVVIRDLPFEAWVEGEHPHWPGEKIEVLTPAAKEVQSKVQAIHRAYNYDGSEIQVDYFDVNYYGQVEVESPSSRDFRLSEEAKKKEARKNAAAKREVVERLMARGYKKGHLRNASYERLAALEAKILEREGQKV